MHPNDMHWDLIKGLAAEITECDMSWLAGIFEGEGSAGVRSGKARHGGGSKTRTLFMSVSQTNREMLEEVKRIVGCGNVYSVRKSKENYKQQWMWYIACRQAREALNRLLPYIRSPHKREQVMVALAEDAKAREIGTRTILATLTKCREQRWEDYRSAQVS